MQFLPKEILAIGQNPSPRVLIKGLEERCRSLTQSFLESAVRHSSHESALINQ